MEVVDCQGRGLEMVSDAHVHSILKHQAQAHLDRSSVLKVLAVPILVVVPLLEQRQGIACKITNIFS